MRRRALLVFIISMCTDCICRLQEISGWTNNRITQTLRKGVCVCAFFFGLKSKTESREVFICVLLFLPCDSLQLKNKTLLWPLWSRTLQQPGRGLLKNWEYVSWLFVFLLFCFLFSFSFWFWKSSSSAFTDSEISSPWQHCGARMEAQELLFGYSRGTKDASRPLCGGSE